MRVRRNFGTMHPDWQDRNPKNKDTHGFRVTFADGTIIEHLGGLATITDEQIREHGRVVKAKELPGTRREYPQTHSDFLPPDCKQESS